MHGIIYVTLKINLLQHPVFYKRQDKTRVSHMSRCTIILQVIISFLSSYRDTLSPIPPRRRPLRRGGATSPQGSARRCCPCRYRPDDPAPQLKPYIHEDERERFVSLARFVSRITRTRITRRQARSRSFTIQSGALSFSLSLFLSLSFFRARSKSVQRDSSFGSTRAIRS